MAEYIERQAAIDIAEKAFIRGLLATPDLRRLPAAQPEIVRCKDCKHYVEYHKLCKGMDQYTCHMNPDDFCSHGEKRERSKEHGEKIHHRTAGKIHIQNSGWK